MNRLDTRVALVTGANKGIGLAIADRFLKEKGIIYAAVRDLETVSDELTELQNEYPENLFVIKLDVTNKDDCRSAFQTIKKEQGKIDILVNNAGRVSYELVPFINYVKFDEMIQTNIVGVVRLCQLASRFMSKERYGSIINISSIVSVKGVAGQAAYAATKGAVNSFTLSLSKELASAQVRVNAIAPGMVGTERLLKVIDEKMGDKIDTIGLSRLASPEDVANVCLFLASEESSYVTGQIIGVDGSLTI